MGGWKKPEIRYVPQGQKVMNTLGSGGWKIPGGTAIGYWRKWSNEEQDQCAAEGCYERAIDGGHVYVCNNHFEYIFQDDP